MVTGAVVSLRCWVFFLYIFLVTSSYITTAKITWWIIRSMPMPFRFYSCLLIYFSNIHFRNTERLGQPEEKITLKQLQLWPKRLRSDFHHFSMKLKIPSTFRSPGPQASAPEATWPWKLMKSDNPIQCVDSSTLILTCWARWPCWSTLEHWFHWCPGPTPPARWSSKCTNIFNSNKAITAVDIIQGVLFTGLS